MARGENPSPVSPLRGENEGATRIPAIDDWWWIGRRLHRN
jgi:hypothetical protein